MSEKLYRISFDVTERESKHIQDCFDGGVWTWDWSTAKLGIDEVSEELSENFPPSKRVGEYKWTKIETLKLAIYSAVTAKKYFDEPVQIIEDCLCIAEKILGEYEKGREPSVEMLESALAAARWTWAAREAADAARAAAWAVESAAWTAETAAWAAEATNTSDELTAAKAAACAASAAALAQGVAYSAAWAKVKQKIHEYCLEIIEEADGKASEIKGGW